MTPLRIGSLLVLALLTACSGDDADDGAVRYSTHVEPILQHRCVICHYPGFSRDLVDPFNAENGMFVNQNRFWLNGHDTYEYNVVPGDPDASAMIRKVTDRELLLEACDPLANVGDDCPIERVGLFMPPSAPRATPEQIERVRRWIAEGAENDEFFRTSIAPLFGDMNNLRNDPCGRGGYGPACILCTNCHYEGTSVPPDLTQPFESLINVPALYRSDMMLVVPGDPDASFLVKKMEARAYSTAFGSPMPYVFEPLSEAQVGTLRQWIVEGAKPD